MTASSDEEWLRRATAAGYVIEKRYGTYAVVDASGKVRGRFKRRYEATAFVGRAIGRETKAFGEHVDRLVVERSAAPVDPVPTWAGRLPLRPGHAVYRALDAEGSVLYVGLSSQLWARIGKHHHAAPWWPDAVDLDWAIYPTRREAENAERRLIRQHRPPWNVAGNLPQAN